MRLPENMLTADSIALIYDVLEGLNHYRDFGRLDALFADPTLARDRTYLTLLREYLDGESVAPLAIRQLVQRHADNVDKVFRTLLRRREKAFFDREPTPSISTVGERLAQLLRTTR